MEAKPTTYRGTLFRSRLEATWAVFFDYYPMIEEWDYEPCKLLQLSTGWDYTPDFRLSIGPYELFLEVKPVIPNPDFLKYSVAFSIGANLPIYLGYGSFYHQTPRTVDLTALSHLHGADLKPRHLEQSSMPFHCLFPASETAVKIASHFRFDIPNYVPPKETQEKPGIRERIAKFFRRRKHK